MDSVFTAAIDLNYPQSTTNGSSKNIVLEETRCRSYHHSNAKPIPNLITFEAITHEQIMKTVQKQLEEVYKLKES
jgi:hypothetical protein